MVLRRNETEKQAQDVPFPLSGFLLSSTTSRHCASHATMTRHPKQTTRLVRSLHHSSQPMPVALEERPFYKMARTNQPMKNSDNCRLYNVPEVSYGSVHISDDAALSSSLNGANKNPSKGPLGFASTRSVATDSPATQEHLGKHRQYWRDIILGGKPCMYIVRVHS